MYCPKRNCSYWQGTVHEPLFLTKSPEELTVQERQAAELLDAAVHRRGIRQMAHRTVLGPGDCGSTRKSYVGFTVDSEIPDHPTAQKNSAGEQFSNL